MQIQLMLTCWSDQSTFWIAPLCQPLSVACVHHIHVHLQTTLVPPPELMEHSILTQDESIARASRAAVEVGFGKYSCLVQHHCVVCAAL